MTGSRGFFDVLQEPKDMSVMLADGEKVIIVHT